MAQFDVSENEAIDSKASIPFLVDVQHDLHRNLSTRSVIPLVVSGGREIKKLYPKFNVLGQDVILSTPEMAGYPVHELGKRVMSLSGKRTEILGAIDFLLSGFLYWVGL